MLVPRTTCRSRRSRACPRRSPCAPRRRRGRRRRSRRGRPCRRGPSPSRPRSPLARLSPVSGVSSLRWLPHGFEGWPRGRARRDGSRRRGGEGARRGRGGAGAGRSRHWRSRSSRLRGRRRWRPWRGLSGSVGHAMSFLVVDGVDVSESRGPPETVVTTAGRRLRVGCDSRALRWAVADVASVVDETARVRSLALDVPGWPGHLPGQHVDVRLTAEDGYQAQRSYSIASPPDGGRVDDHGRGARRRRGLAVPRRGAARGRQARAARPDRRLLRVGAASSAGRCCSSRAARASCR